jgi:poly-beta-1,6-N-acetyl-D-glucosamine synthase
MILELVFFAAVAVILYTYAGYPIAIAILAAVAPRPARKEPVERQVTIVIVAHNGREELHAKVVSCLAQDYPSACVGILFVSDGSTDGSMEVMRVFAEPRVRAVEFAQRRGKAACLNDAVAMSQGEIIVFTDVRQVLSPQAVSELVANFADKSVGAVSGELVFRQEGITHFGQAVDAYWKYEKFLRRAEARFHSAIGVTGAIYAIRRDCFRPIPPDTVLDDVLIPMSTVMQGHRVTFESRAVAYDRPSNEPRNERVRKVRTLAGNFQLIWRHPEFMLPWRNPVAFQFVSHKLMRLLVPPALALALGTSVALAAHSPLFQAALALQAALYALAFAGLAWRSANRLLLFRMPATFLVLNWFVVLGFIEFAFNRKAHLWKSR